MLRKYSRSSIRACLRAQEHIQRGTRSGLEFDDAVGPFLELIAIFHGHSHEFSDHGRGQGKARSWIRSILPWGIMRSRNSSTIACMRGLSRSSTRGRKAWCTMARKRCGPEVHVDQSSGVMAY